MKGLPEGVRDASAASACGGRVVSDMPCRPVARKLASHPPRARTTFQRPLQRFRTRGVDVRRRTAVLGQPVVDDVQVVVLLEGVERQPQAEALGQGYLFFHGLAWMDFAIRLML